MRFQDLLAYKKSFELGMSIFQISKSFPIEEKYSLTDQIRRSSRSVSVNIAEATRKRNMSIILFLNSPIVMPKIQKLSHG
jgi:four helix bundle protein